MDRMRARADDQFLEASSDSDGEADSFRNENSFLLFGEVMILLTELVQTVLIFFTGLVLTILVFLTELGFTVLIFPIVLTLTVGGG